MKPLEPRTFQIPELKGISVKTIEEHIKLYQGYVKNANTIWELGSEFAKDDEKYGYASRELHRKFSFEYNGIKNHEYYFEQLEGGTQEISAESQFKKDIVAMVGSWEAFLEHFKKTATTTRGIGWMVVYYDRERKLLLTTWVDEQHLGHLNSCQFIFGIDMWEHSYVADYLPSGKKQYVEDYLANVNWSVVEKRYQECL